MRYLKQITLSEIIALTLATSFIGYRAYQLIKNPHEYKLMIEQSLTNSPYLNPVYDSKESFK